MLTQAVSPKTDTSLVFATFLPIYEPMCKITVGVLALQGAFYEHLQLLQKAVVSLKEAEGSSTSQWEFIEVRNVSESNRCDALVLPGGESTTISLVAASSNLLEPLRDFVKLRRKPTWGTCAGLILLAESANRTKKGDRPRASKHCWTCPSFIRWGSRRRSRLLGCSSAVEKILSNKEGIQTEEGKREETIVAPSRAIDPASKEAIDNRVEVLAKLPGRAARLSTSGIDINVEKEAGDIVAVRQGTVFGTSFHPELTDDPRIHMWWLHQVRGIVDRGRNAETLPLR
ncbi:hypothetical protein Egran_05251 [Elaphomyces granulatus]|uniref:glutaminase n=1 Tax=Elaphomyces granulatus TaxID=519963 RepID=A0A232LS42_9EURO|nr:hypothetical protein Egran_05251 [Elaphomyces granulatus]